MLTKQQIIDALRAFAEQRPGIEPGNYGSWRDYRNESASVTRDLHDARELIRACEWRDGITAEMMLEGFRAFSGRLSIESVRKHKCSCGHSFTAPVKLSEHTANLSGEATQFCPKCGKRPEISSPVSARISYCTGQYFPTEFRKAVAAVCSSALCDYWRDQCMPSAIHHSDGSTTYPHVVNGKANQFSAGDWLRRSFRREFGPRLANRYFN